MSAIPITTASNAAVPASRAGRWLRDGLLLWRRAPFMLILLCLCTLLIEALLQLIPLFGVVVSKLVVPMCGAGIWIGLHAVQRGERLRFSSLWAGWRESRWVTLWLLSAIVGLAQFGFQVASAWLAYGYGAIDAVVFGHMAAHPELMSRSFEWTLLLPGVLPGIMLVLVAPLFLFRGASIIGAIRGSVHVVMASPLAFGLLMVLQTALFALCFATAWTMLLLLLLLPWSAALSYAVWNDLTHDSHQHDAV